MFKHRHNHSQPMSGKISTMNTCLGRSTQSRKKIDPLIPKTTGTHLLTLRPLDAAQIIDPWANLRGPKMQPGEDSGAKCTSVNQTRVSEKGRRNPSARRKRIDGLNTATGES
jgi:hypothetical protein